MVRIYYGNYKLLNGKKVKLSKAEEKARKEQMKQTKNKTR